MTLNCSSLSDEVDLSGCVNDWADAAVDAVWGGHPHENPGRRPKNRASGLG